VPRAMPIIDAHAHVTADRAELAVSVMDAAGIDAVVVCEWFEGYGQQLQDDLKAFAAFPGRFLVFGNVDFPRIDQPDFARAAVDDLRRAAENGMRGLKIYKQLGLGYRDASGTLLRVDDDRLDPIWAACGELGLPVLMHTADPRAFWEPVDADNPWQLVFAAYPEWSYYRKGLPGRAELLAERSRVVRRHPGTNFIGPHLGSWEDDFGTLAEMLQAMPNLYVDISARFYAMGMTARRRAAARALLEEFSDRILFGTDTILVRDSAPGDIQPQTFLTRPRLPQRFADAGDRTLFATSVWFYEFHRAFLETGGTLRPIPFLCRDPDEVLLGLDLPEPILHRLYHENVERLVGGCL
jgi:predicted TIM-barrel fold metal-dependent hydrolase